jgi:hypothetical protein
VAAGDIVAVGHGTGERPYKVVHKIADDRSDGVVYIVTYQDDDGETFQIEYAAGTIVNRTMDARWESEQSPQCTD